MKIKYTFATGENTEVEVNDEIGTIILDSRRKEKSRDRMEERHCYSMDAIEYEGMEYADERTPETELISKINNRRLANALDQLTPIQSERLLKLASGMSVRKIAESEGKDHKTVLESINAARKKIKKFL